MRRGNLDRVHRADTRENTRIRCGIRVTRSQNCARKSVVDVDARNVSKTTACMRAYASYARSRPPNRRTLFVLISTLVYTGSLGNDYLPTTRLPIPTRGGLGALTPCDLQLWHVPVDARGEVCE